MDYDPPDIFRFNNSILSIVLCLKQACIELVFLLLKMQCSHNMHFVLTVLEQFSKRNQPDEMDELYTAMYARVLRYYTIQTYVHFTI